MMQKDRDLLFLPPLLAIISFVALFFFRAVDDNRLTSWQWVFRHADPVKVFLALVAGCGCITIFSWYCSGEGLSLHRSPYPGETTQNGCLSPISVVRRSFPFLIFLSFFSCAMLFWGMPEVIVDASRYFTQAKYLERFGVGYFLHEWGGEIQAWTDLPLIPFFYGLIFRVLGESRSYVQFFTTSLFAMTGVLTYMTGRALWDEETGIYSAAFLLCIPYLLTQVPLMLVDVPTMFFLMLSIYTFIKALKCGGIWMGFSSLSIFCTFLSKYSAWLMLSVLPVIFFVLAFSKEEPKTRTCISRAVVTASAACLLIGIFLLANYHLIREQIGLLLSYQKPALERWEESFLSTFLFQIHPLVTATALYSGYVAVKKRDLKYIIILWLVLVIVLLQIRRIRYIIMVFPLICLMASYGLRYVRSNEAKKVFVSCAVVSSLVIASFAYLPFLQKLSAENLKKAGEFLDTRNASEVEVYILQPDDPAGNLIVTVPLIDLFTRKTILHNDDLTSGQTKQAVWQSPLRFTWQFRNPSYYRSPDIGWGADIVAIVSESAKEPLPLYLHNRLAGFELVKSFDDYEGIFRFRSSVRVYEKKI